MDDAFFTKEVQGLSEERLKLIRQAAKDCQGKSGLERLDVMISYAEKMSEGGQLGQEEQKALLAAVAATLKDGERKQLEQMMSILGM
ncbi:MAG: hypothetical protein R3Y53_08900 [Bacillota bacterium]